MSGDLQTRKILDSHDALLARSHEDEMTGLTTIKERALRTRNPLDTLQLLPGLDDTITTLHLIHVHHVITRSNNINLGHRTQFLRVTAFQQRDVGLERIIVVAEDLA